jgi:hypothetical protein
MNNYNLYESREYKEVKRTECEGERGKNKERKKKIIYIKDLCYLY